MPLYPRLPHGVCFAALLLCYIHINADCCLCPLRSLLRQLVLLRPSILSVCYSLLEYDWVYAL